MLTVDLERCKTLPKKIQRNAPATCQCHYMSLDELDSNKAQKTMLTMSRSRQKSSVVNNSKKQKQKKFKCLP